MNWTAWRYHCCWPLWVHQRFAKKALFISFFTCNVKVIKIHSKTPQIFLVWLLPTHLECSFQNGFKNDDHQELINMIKAIASHFNRSAKACDALKNLQESKKIKLLRLIPHWHPLVIHIGNANSVSRNWAIALPSCERPKNSSAELAFSLSKRGAKNDCRKKGYLHAWRTRSSQNGDEEKVCCGFSISIWSFRLVENINVRSKLYHVN